jgi:hypothetical protein
MNALFVLDRSRAPIPVLHAAFAGPGTAYQGYGEHNQRHWLSMWCDALEREPPTVTPFACGAPNGARS